MLWDSPEHLSMNQKNMLLLWELLPLTHDYRQVERIGSLLFLNICDDNDHVIEVVIPLFKLL